jgi:hypothetical protein
MNNTNTGGPAFPYGTAYAGMTLRDYFAAKALEALIGRTELEDGELHNPAIYAEASYEMADAMLRAREQ